MKKVMKEHKAIRVRDWQLLALVYIGFVLLHIWLGMEMTHPIVYNDEAGYFGNARLLASGYGLPKMGIQYYPGYSLFLVPIFKLISDPLSAYRAALITNAFLLSTNSIAVYLLTKYICPDVKKTFLFAGVLLVSCYPPFLVYSNLVMSENVYIPLFTFLCLTGIHAFKGRHWLSWFLWGVLAGFLFIVHPKALPVIISVIIVSFKVLSPLIKNIASWISVFLGLLITIVPGFILKNYLFVKSSELNASSNLLGYGDSTSKAIFPHLKPVMLLNLVYEVAGQVFYLGVSTYGLFVVGIIISLICLKKFLIDNNTDPKIQVSAFISLSMLGTLILSSLFMNAHAQRADHLIYGRYNEGVLSPIVLLGFISLINPFWRKKIGCYRWSMYFTLTLIISSILLYLGRRDESAFTNIFVFVNVIGVHHILSIKQKIDIVALITGGLGIGLPTIFLLYKRKISVLFVLITIFGFTAYNFSAYMASGSKSYAEIGLVSKFINLIKDNIHPELNCVSSDKTVLSSSYAVYATSRFLAPRIPFSKFDVDKGETPCSDLIISGRSNLDKVYPGARLATLENHHSLSLWVLPGTLKDKLDAKGLLLPPNFPSELPETAYKSILKFEEKIKSPIKLIQTTDPPLSLNHMELPLSVTHIGKGSPWPNLFGTKQNQYSVRLGLLWFDKKYLSGLADIGKVNLINSVDISKRLLESRVELPQTLHPGETVNLVVQLNPEDSDGSKLPEGDYEVWIGLVQEGVTWFYQKGDNILKVNVQIE